MIVEYILLDTHFDWVRTHHFVLLNDFCHGVKISFPFYLFSSLCKNIEGFKKKSSANPSLHEGLLLLLYEFFKVQTRGKLIPYIEGGSDDTESNGSSSESKGAKGSMLDVGEESLSSSKKLKKGKATPLLRAISQKGEALGSPILNSTLNLRKNPM